MNKFLMLLAVLFSLSLQGCMTYSHHELAQGSQWPPATSTKVKPAAYLKVQAEYALNEDRANSGTNIAALEKLLKEELQGSQRFSKVSVEREPSDLYVTATLRNHEEGSLGLAFLTRLHVFPDPQQGRQHPVAGTHLPRWRGQETGASQQAGKTHHLDAPGADLCPAVQ